MAKTSLYRHYDREGRLLYVGISLRHLDRLSQHRNASSWYWNIRRVDVTHYPSREMAERAERRAIRTECPVHNIVRAAPTPINSAVIDEVLRRAPKLKTHIGPPAPRRIGYMRLLPDADYVAAAEMMVAGNVDPSLVFIDDASQTDCPMLLRTIKTAQHAGTTIVCLRRSDFWDSRALLRSRGVRIEKIKPGDDPAGLCAEVGRLLRNARTARSRGKV